MALLMAVPSTWAADGPAWLSEGQPTPQARQLLSILRHVDDYGLSREEFALLADDIETGMRAADEARSAAALDAAALRLMHELHDGRVAPRDAGYELRRRRAPVDFTAMLGFLAGSPDVGATLSSLEPRSAQYRALKQALARYRGFVDRFEPSPPAGVTLHSGDKWAGAGALRRRLEELGDALGPVAQDSRDDLYDADLAAAVARFQRRHGLEADGVLGGRTREALAVPMSRRVRQIELTLERWRWLPDLKAPTVIVNLPQYMLYLLPDPQDAGPALPTRRIPVIVGRQKRQTPVFDSEIEAVVFRPYWDVPRDIVRDEILPLIERDPAYLARHDMEIVQGDRDALRVLPEGGAAIAALRAGRARLRQRPGEQNALGLIKFVLPNPYAIYLHSTPEASLFGRERRDLSHGCVRVSDVTALAAYLLRRTPGDWSVDAIELATCASAPTSTVRLAAPVPVFILYGTVVMEGDQPQFFDDIYGYDARLDTLLGR